jgi:hypothetical protein
MVKREAWRPKPWQEGIEVPLEFADRFDAVRLLFPEFIRSGVDDEKREEHYYLTAEYFEFIAAGAAIVAKKLRGEA